MGHRVGRVWLHPRQEGFQPVHDHELPHDGDRKERADPDVAHDITVPTARSQRRPARTCTAIPAKKRLCRRLRASTGTRTTLSLEFASSAALLMTSFTEPNCKGTSHTSVQQLDVCEVIFENHTRVFVVRHCNGGPSPTTPTPTTPAPANKTFAQKHCSDSQCTLGCQSQTFPQGVCLRLSGGGSAIAECSAAGLTLKIYTTSGCTGSYTTNTMPVNKCLQSSSGGYFENICNNGAAALSTGTLHTL